MSAAVDFGCFADARDGRFTLYMQVEGMRCAACAWKIEQTLLAHPGVEARVNFSTQRLRITWPQASAANDNGAGEANHFAGEIEALGFHVAPFDPDSRAQDAREEARELLSCLAVAGFATLGVMLFTDPLWFLSKEALSGPTRDLMHWAMGLIAMPATLYSGRPFFRSALSALGHRRMNMDVPISLAVLLANGLSLFETIRQGAYVYFDASVMLLFFLLVGRYLDQKARGKARETAEGLLAMLEGTASVRRGTEIVAVRIRDVRPGDTLIVAAGEKIAADGVVSKGVSDIDSHLVTGETLPREIAAGGRVYAGMINQSAPLEVEVSVAADGSLLSEIVGLMEKAEQSQSPYVRLADRVAGIYAPAVHLLALATFVGWLGYGAVTGQGLPWEEALLRAVSVLIITCPCALALAVPVVQVLASSHLFSKGILLKSGCALEAIAAVDTVVFDKTGTLTEGTAQWLNPEVLPPQDRVILAAMAAQSRHPLSQALAKALGGAGDLSLEVVENAGRGLKASRADAIYWLGKASWLGIDASADDQMELWYRSSSAGRLSAPVRLLFADHARDDALEVIRRLHGLGLQTVMLSGDRRAVAEPLGRDLGIGKVEASLSPIDKVEVIRRLQADGHKVLMVGDGLNDAAALTAADASMSPATAMDITQNAADVVYRGDLLMPVITTLRTARVARLLARENFMVSAAYNLLAVPAAVFGLATPLIAALAMSSSSFVVVLNALRLKWLVKG